MSKQSVLELLRLLLASSTPGPFHPVYDEDEKEWLLLDESESIVATVYASSMDLKRYGTARENAHHLASALNALPLLLDLAEHVANAKADGMGGSIPGSWEGAKGVFDALKALEANQD